MVIRVRPQRRLRLRLLRSGLQTRPRRVVAYPRSAWQPLPGVARGQAGEDFWAVDERQGHVGQAQVASPGVVTQDAERLVHVQAEALGELALGLLDDDPAIQRGLQLLISGCRCDARCARAAC